MVDNSGAEIFFVKGLFTCRGVCINGILYPFTHDKRHGSEVRIFQASAKDAIRPAGLLIFLFIVFLMKDSFAMVGNPFADSPYAVNSNFALAAFSPSADVVQEGIEFCDHPANLGSESEVS